MPSVAINETVSISEDSKKSESDQKGQVTIVISSVDQDKGTRQLVGYFNYNFFFIS